MLKQKTFYPTLRKPLKFSTRLGSAYQQAQNLSGKPLVHKVIMDGYAFDPLDVTINVPKALATHAVVPYVRTQVIPYVAKQTLTYADLAAQAMQPLMAPLIDATLPYFDEAKTLFNKGAHYVVTTTFPPKLQAELFRDLRIKKLAKRTKRKFKANNAHVATLKPASEKQKNKQVIKKLIMDLKR